MVQKTTLVYTQYRTGTTYLNFSIASVVPNYKNVTVSDFSVVKYGESDEEGNENTPSSGSAGSSQLISSNWSYNPSTGVFSTPCYVYYSASSNPSQHNRWHSYDCYYYVTYWAEE